MIRRVEQMTFPRFAALAVEGPDMPVHGVVQGRGSTAMGWVGRPPVVIGHGSGGHPLRVWRDGALVRTETAQARVLLLADEEWVWTFDDGESLPARSPRSALVFNGGWGPVLRRPRLATFLRGPLAAPVGEPRAGEFQGRATWAQSFAEGAELVLDAASGWPLRSQDAAGQGEWTEFSVGPARPPQDFRWTGEVRPYVVPLAPDAQRQHREREERLAAGLVWYRENVGNPERTAQMGTQFTVRLGWLHELDETTGSFTARLELTDEDGGHHLQMGRWPLGGAETERFFRGDDVFRWRTTDHEWGLEWSHRNLGRDVLAAVAATFGAR
jgi:hypothetical protein